MKKPVMPKPKKGGADYSEEEPVKLKPSGKTWHGFGGKKK